MYKGIDVSSNNGVLDWDTIKSQIDYAIIRGGYGSDEPGQDDSQAIRNMQECERLGIPYGVYLYSYALNMDEARSEAAHVLRMVQGFNPVLGVWFDMEDADGYKARHGFIPEQNGQELTDFCLEFMQIIKDAGYLTGVYASYSYFVNVLDDSRLTAFDGFNRWLAHWGIDFPSMDCLHWQYSSDGIVDGNGSSRMDMNYYYGELEDIESDTPNDDGRTWSREQATTVTNALYNGLLHRGYGEGENEAIVHGLEYDMTRIEAFDSIRDSDEYKKKSLIADCYLVMRGSLPSDEEVEFWFHQSEDEIKQGILYSDDFNNKYGV